MLAILLLAVACLFSSVLMESPPTVTLKHGGTLQGLSTSFMSQPLDLFLGVRYAQPPTGKLRFRRPEAAAPWIGVKDATAIGSVCSQLTVVPVKRYLGDEDCLFLDISVPGGVTPGSKKPVMVWIHGGGFRSGSGSSYAGGVPLAVTGDIIVVTMNYRLGVLGFLTAAKGTGNFGLWDQRAALLWVKENIAQFGGDPDSVTIFGGSAGAQSVSSQMMSPHNDGLFKRAIQQSGSMYHGGFDISENMRDRVAQSMRQQTKCRDGKDLYECFNGVSSETIENLQLTAFMGPSTNDDFFAMESVKNMDYKLSQRFDLLAGFNGQEGGLIYKFVLAGIAKMSNRSINTDGVDLEFTQSYLASRCATQLTPLSAELCTDFLMNTYKLDNVTDDKERTTAIIDLFGDLYFNADITNQLEQHSVGDKSTYAYYFTELYKPTLPNPLRAMPDWLKTKADHGDEIRFVFGGSFIKEEAKSNNVWRKMVVSNPLADGMFIKSASDANRPLSTLMMQMWTNFAKSGKPTEPASLPAGIPIPTWPQFDTNSNQFLEINSKLSRLITTPHKEKLHKLIENILMTKRQQQDSDRSAIDICSRD